MFGGNNGKVLTVSWKLAKILTDSRKSHHPIETQQMLSNVRLSSPFKSARRTLNIIEQMRVQDNFYSKFR